MQLGNIQIKLILKLNQINKMNPNSRVRPSVIPLKSPSPDLTNSNVITPTKSPSKGEIIRHNTPIMSLIQSDHKFNNKSEFHSSKERKIINTTNISGNYKSHSTQKDNFINNNGADNKSQLYKELKKILLQINENELVSEFEDFDDRAIGITGLKEQNGRLRLQNEGWLKLAHNENYLGQILQENKWLKQKIQSLHLDHRREVELMQLESKNGKNVKDLYQNISMLQKENSGLLKLLKEKDESERKLYQDMMDSKSKIEEQSLKRSTTKGETQRISVVKDFYRNNINNSKDVIGIYFNQTQQFMNKCNQAIFLKLEENQKRIETLNKFLIASLKYKHKNQQFLNKQLLRGSSYHSQFKKLNTLVDSLNYNSATENREKERVHESFKVIEELRKDLARQQQTNQKTIRLINQKVNQIDKLERQHKSLIFRKDDEINELKQLNNNFKKQYKGKCDQFQAAILSKDKLLQQLKNNTQSKIQEVIQNYQRELAIIRNQLKKLQRYEISKDTQVVNVNENQLQTKITMLLYQKQDLQSKLQYNEQRYKNKIKQHDERMDQVTSLMRNVEQKINGKQHEIIKLNYALIQKSDIQKQLMQQVEQLKHKLNNKQQSYELRITQQKLFKKQKQYEQLAVLVQNFKGRNITKQLQQIRQMLNFDGIIQMEQQFHRITLAFNQIAIDLENKVYQLNKITKQFISVQQQLSNSEKQRAHLIQKVGYLQRNQEIYQAELKQRKQFCEELIQNRTILQKDAILLKKSYATAHSSSITYQNIILAAQKIDKLIQIESQNIL